MVVFMQQRSYMMTSQFICECLLENSKPKYMYMQVT